MIFIIQKIPEIVEIFSRQGFWKSDVFREYILFRILKNTPNFRIIIKKTRLNFRIHSKSQAVV
jgi:hypothetical protein